MKKRIFGTILAAALIVTQAVAAFAAPLAPSKTALPSVTGSSASSYIITAASSESFSDVKNEEVINDLLAVNNGTKSLTDVVGKTTPELTDQLAGKEMVSPFFDLKPVNGGIKNEEGKYVVTISVPSLTKAMTDVQILHYSTVRNLFELITPTSVDYEGKTITAVFEDLSPVAIIAKVDASKAADSTVGISPKTGVPSTWMVFFGAAVILAGVSAVAYRKER